MLNVLIGLMLVFCCSFVLYPLRRDFQIRYLIVFLIIPPISLLTYFTIGSPQSTYHDLASSRTNVNSSYSELIDKLKVKLSKNPDNPQGWSLLARTLSETRQYNSATSAFEKAIQQSPKDVDLLTDYADLLATFKNDTFDKKAKVLLSKALRINPQNIKARMVIANLFFEEKNYQAAIENWEAILKSQNIDPNLQIEINFYIDETEKLMLKK